LIRDPDVYERFERVVLVHGCRFIAELGLQPDDQETLRKTNSSAPLVANQLIYYRP